MIVVMPNGRHYRKMTEATPLNIVTADKDAGIFNVFEPGSCSMILSLL